jgi:hypothetical protein
LKSIIVSKHWIKFLLAVFELILGDFYNSNTTIIVFLFVWHIFKGASLIIVMTLSNYSAATNIGEVTLLTYQKLRGFFALFEKIMMESRTNQLQFL